MTTKPSRKGKRMTAGQQRRKTGASGTGRSGTGAGGSGAARTGPAANRSNRAWITRHVTDSWVQRAQEQGFRSRAAFKLLGIDERDGLIRRGMVVIDLGSAPGAWSQVLRARLARTGAGGGIDGRIIAVDLLPMEPVADVEFIQGDIREASTWQQLDERLGDARVDLVISDMAPNLSGIAAADAARMSDLADLAVDLARQRLKKDGALLVKCFHGSGYSQIVENFRRHFRQVAARKPEASRSISAETYLLGRGLRKDL